MLSPQPNFCEMLAEEHVAGQLIVRFREAANQSKIVAFFSRHNLPAEQVRLLDDNLQIYLITLPEGKSEAACLSDFLEDDIVLYAEPNYIGHLTDIPNDPSFPSQWNLSGDYVGGINAPAAWNIEKGNSEVIVAVIDSGIGGDVQDIAPLGSPQYVWPLDLADDDNYPLDTKLGHGTEVTGVINAMTNNGVGIAGVCWNNVKIMPIRIAMQGGGEPYTTSGLVSSAFKWAADHGAKVANCSWGFDGSSYSMADEVAYAIGKGCTIVAAAGNSNQNRVGYPAAYNGVIAAGSCTAGGNKSSFSCYGAGLDLLAPGDMVLSTSPKFKGSYYSVVSGTSFSAPHVAAVAALLLSKYPNLTPGWIQAILQGSASRPSGYNETFYGAGLLNAYSALTYPCIPNPPSEDVTPVRSQWYLAEGCTRPGFEEYVSVENASDQTARVQFTFMLADELPLKHVMNMGPGSRYTLPVHGYVYGKDVSVQVTSDQEVFAERSMYWSNKREGHTSHGIEEPAFQWYLAEGSTRQAEGFREYVLLMNPDNDTEFTQVTFMREDGHIYTLSYSLAPQSRQTICVNDVQDFGNCDVSTVVTCSQDSPTDKGIIVERAMYWDIPDGGQPKDAYGGHGAPGVTSAECEWYLAEGSTRDNEGFEEWVLLENPGNTAAVINITYMTETGPVNRDPFTIAPHSRFNIHVNQESVNGESMDNRDVSVRVASSVPIISERAMYWRPTGYTGLKGPGHDSEGVSKKANVWNLAEGCTAMGFEEYILIQNPGNDVASVTVTFMSSGGVIGEPYTPSPLGGGVRRTIRVHDLVQDNYEVSARIDSSQPIIVERSMYWNSKWGGTDSVGIARNLEAGNTQLPNPSTVALDPFTLIFSNLLTEGHTVLVTTDPMADFEDPSENPSLFYQGVPLSLIYDVGTSATYSGDVTVIFSYGAPTPKLALAQYEPNFAPRLFQYDELSDSWFDITTQTDEINGTVTGVCAELGRFCLMIPWSSFYSGLWNRQAANAPYDLFGVTAVDDSTAFAVGDGGELLRTTDGGANWVLKDTGTSQPLLAVGAGDAFNVWASGVSGIIIKSSDGGETWNTQQPEGSHSDLDSISAVDAATAWVCGSNGIIEKTTDGGSTWQVIKAESSIPQRLRISAVSANVAWVVGATSDGAACIEKTEDGGTTWISQPLPIAGLELMGMSAVDSQNAWAVGLSDLNGVILPTSDGGANWESQPAPGLLGESIGPLSAVAAADTQHAWVVGPLGMAMYTDDGGMNWYLQMMGNPFELFLGGNVPIILSVSASDLDTAWAVGSLVSGYDPTGPREGVIYKKDAGPAISYITPTGGTGDLVQIQGYDFGSSRGSSAVLFGSVPATSYVSWDNQHVLVRVPAGVSGTIEVRVVTAAGQSNGVPFLAGWPTPTISSIAPSSGIGDQTMPIFAVSGTNFRSGASVTLKKQGEPDIAATNVVVGSPENLRCDLDITGRATGQWDVVVANPDGQSSLLAGGFTIENPPPAVSSITPASGTRGSIVEVSDLSGSNFRPGVSVLLRRPDSEDIPATNVTLISSGKITCTFDLTNKAEGAWDVVVSNDDGKSAVLPGGFSIGHPAPTVSSIDPNSCAVDSVLGVSIIGSNFLAYATVRLDKGDTAIYAADIQVISDSQISCSFDTSEAAAGIYDVVVANIDGREGSLASGFTITGQAVVVSSITPNSGSTNSVVQITDLSGENFAVGASAWLQLGSNRIDASNVSVSSPSQITCTLDLSGAQTGAWDVVVANTDGQQATLTGGFIVANPALSLSSITPNSGRQNTTVQISNLAGTGFLAGAQVRLEMAGSVINASNVSVLSPSQITCTLNLSGAQTGAWDVVVANTDGQQATLTGGFTITAPPNPCGGGSASAILMLGIMLGLLSAAGSSKRRLKRKRG